MLRGRAREDTLDREAPVVSTNPYEPPEGREDPGRGGTRKPLVRAVPLLAVPIALAVGLAGNLALSMVVDRLYWWSHPGASAWDQAEWWNDLRIQIPVDLLAGTPFLLAGWVAARLGGHRRGLVVGCTAFAFFAWSGFVLTHLTGIIERATWWNAALWVLAPVIVVAGSRLVRAP